MTKPNLPLAIVFGLVAPGAGLWYAGKPLAALGVIALFLAEVVGLPWLAVGGSVDPARLPTLLALSALILWGAAAVAGALVAVRAPEAKRAPWLHPWWVLGVVVLTWAASSLLRTHVVAPHLVSFATVADGHLEPEVRHGGLVVVKRRYAPSEIRPGALVLVAGKDGPASDHVERVQSLESGIHLEDGSRTSPADILGIATAAH